jgi:serine/alanine adding enzyme
MRIIRDYKEIDKNRWREFVRSHPNGSVFQTPDMYNVYVNSRYCKPLVLAGIDNERNIIAILLAVIQRESYDPMGILTSRSIIIGGPLITGNDIEILDSLVKAYSSAIKRRVIYSQIRNFSEQSSTLKDVFIRNGFLFEDHLNILIDLSIGIDSLWSNVKRNRKDGINKAKRQGFVFKHLSDLRDLKIFYSLHSELYHNIKLPYPAVSFFSSANTHLKDHIKWFSLEYQAKPVIVLFALTFNHVLYAHSIGISQNPDI